MKNLPAVPGPGSIPGLGVHSGKDMAAHPSTLAESLHGQRSLEDCSPLGLRSGHDW